MIQLVFQYVNQGKGDQLIKRNLEDFLRRTFPSNNRCESCPNFCDTCANATSCLTCRQSLLLLNGQCVDECPEGYYTFDQQCFPCHPICKTCKGKFNREIFVNGQFIIEFLLGPLENDCKSCSQGFQFDPKEKQCLSLCPNGNYFHRDEHVSTIIILPSLDE